MSSFKDKILIVIPARAGSKRLPNKNVLMLGDKALIQHTIKFAIEHFDSSQICISTDSEEVKSISRSMNVPVLFDRPEKLCQDSTGMREVILHAVDFYSIKDKKSFEYILLLQPTSPFRSVSTLNKLIDEQQVSKAEATIGMHKTKANPYFVLYEEKDNKMEKLRKGDFSTFQSLPDIWEVNGSFYLINIEALRSQTISEFKHVAKVETTRFESIDIDDLYDFKYAEVIYNELLNPSNP